MVVIFFCLDRLCCFIKQGHILRFVQRFNRVIDGVDFWQCKLLRLGKKVCTLSNPIMIAIITLCGVFFISTIPPSFAFFSYEQLG